METGELITTELSILEEVRLTAFKNFSGATLPIEELTLLVGRNGSGKSNALDGLWVLSRLAQGDDVRDALDGGRDGPAVRGGAAGCAPFGSNSFSLGCTVRTGASTVRLDVRVQVAPSVQVVAETVSLNGTVLVETDPPLQDSGDIIASWNNSKKGPNPKVSFRASRLLAGQVAARVPVNTHAGQRIHLAAAQALAALRSVFVLDPVPHLMRQYVPSRDIVLRRDADNVSAAVASLMREPSVKRRLCEALGRLNEQEIVNLTISRSDLDDVMLALSESFAGKARAVSARVMSDGSLRFLAILVALLQAPTTDTDSEAASSEEAMGQTLLVIEELENGLHASQAHLLIELVREEVGRRRVRALATAHSPALLDALTGDEHRSVMVCQRRSDGRSVLHRLAELPNYLDIVASGGLGAAAVKDRLREEAPSSSVSPSAALAKIFAGGRR